MIWIALLVPPARMPKRDSARERHFAASVLDEMRRVVLVRD